MSARARSASCSSKRRNHLLIKALRTHSVAINEQMFTALGPTLSTRIGPNAYGAAFVCEE